MKRIIFFITGIFLSTFIFSQNRVGIGTTTPQSKFHVNNSTSLSNAQYLGGAVSIFENSNAATTSFLQLMNPSTMGFSIASGTDISILRSSLSFQADSSLTFETGGFTQRMKIDKIGTVTIPSKLGIGTTNPITRFHASNGTLANGQYIISAAGIFETSNTIIPGYLQLMNPSQQSFSIGSGTELSFYRSGITFTADSSLTFETGGASQRMKIDKFGAVTIPNRLGIGTTNPISKFHASTGTLSNAQYILGSLGIFESSSPFLSSYIQLMNPSTTSVSIASGTDLAFYRSGITFTADSSLTFETGGVNQRMKIDKTGAVTIPNRLGIGTTNPVSKFHTSLGTLSNAQYIPGSMGIFENSSPVNSYIQLMNPSTSSVSIGSGTDLSFYRSGISFHADSSVTVEAGGVSQRMKIDKAGIVSVTNSVGIGTAAPSANLDVSGTTVIGVNGTVLTEMIKMTVNKNVLNVPANSSINETFTVANTQTTSTVYISPALALANGLIIGYARVSVAGTVEVRFTNVTAADINPSAMDFYITVIR